MIAALALALVLAQGSPTMAGPAPRSTSSADYFASLLATIGTECDGSALTWSDNSAVTTTRASTAYCTASTGAMTLVTANQPRVSSAGLLVEGSRTNIILQSEALDDAAWSGTATVTADSHAPPWGGTTMDTVSSNPAAQVRYQCLNVSSSTGPFVTSGFGRATSGTHAATLTVACSGGHNATNCACYRADGSSCTATASSTQCRGTSTFSTTVDRVFVVSSCASAVTQICQEVYGGTPAVAGDHVWTGLQMEVNAQFASSYIPTTGTSATRAADNISFTPSTSIDAAGCARATVTYGPVFSPVPHRWISTGTGQPISASDATTLFAYDGTTSASATVLSMAGRATTARSAWGTSLSMEESGSAAVTDVFDGTMGGGTVHIGSAGGASGFLYGQIKALKLGSTFTGCNP